MANIRRSDLVVRWGGEEFLVLCRDAKRDEAEAQARRILETIGEEEFNTDESDSVHLTCSIGWAPFPWSDRQPAAVGFEQIIDLADRALYLAKLSGRNQALGLMPLAGDAQIDERAFEPQLVELNGRMLKFVETRGPGIVSLPPRRRHDSIDPEPNPDN
jgi:predicted signal transduction protein with EAL and GGDEF domain